MSDGVNRELIITSCDDCMFFDNYYYNYNEQCERLDRTIKRIEGTRPIPNDCPLPVSNKEGTEEAISR